MTASPTSAAPGRHGSLRPTPRPTLARAAWLIALAGLGVIALLPASALAANPHPSAGQIVAESALVVGLASFVISGCMIISRQMRNPIGWLLLVPGLTDPLATLAGSWLLTLDPAPDRVTPALWIILWATSWSWVLLIFPIFHLLLTFPNGRLLSHRWRWAVALELAMVVTMVGLATFGTELGVVDGDATVWSVTNPIGLVSQDIWDSAFAPIWSVALAGIATASVLAVVVRFRRGDAVERQQLKWPLSAVALFGIVYVPTSVQAGFGSEDIGNLLFGLSLAGIPISVAIAVLRYHLYEIDRIISRTIGWAVTTGLIAAVFGLFIVSLQALLAPITSESTLVVAGSTLVAAAMFQPLRRRVQAAVDRRFNRSRVDAQHAVETFGGHLRDEVDLDAVSRHLIGAATATVEPRLVGLWTRSVRSPVPSNNTVRTRDR